MPLINSSKNLCAHIGLLASPTTLSYAAVYIIKFFRTVADANLGVEITDTMVGKMVFDFHCKDHVSRRTGDAEPSLIPFESNGQWLHDWMALPGNRG